MTTTRILVVDDDPACRESLVEILEEHGHTAVAVNDGSQAIIWLRMHYLETALVLLDLMMPVMDGRSFLRVKEADPALSPVPVIVMTAGGPELCGEVLRTHRIRDCLPKPLNLASLLTLIRGVVSHVAA